MVVCLDMYIFMHITYKNGRRFEMTVRMVTWILTFSIVLFVSIASGEYPAEKPSLNSGREIFISNCAGCHGEKGDGSVLKGAFNFTDHELMITKNSTVFFDAVENGLSGTAMPSFKMLTVPQRWDVASYLWTFWADKAGVEHGKSVYQKNCASCHGMNGDGSGLRGAFDFTNISIMVVMEPYTFFKGVSNGVQGTAMPPWETILSENDRWDAVKYVWTFQFNNNSPVPPPARTPLSEAPSSGEPWYYSPVGISILAISILLAIAVLYLYGKGLRER